MPYPLLRRMCSRAVHTFKTVPGALGTPEDYLRGDTPIYRAMLDAYISWNVEKYGTGPIVHFRSGCNTRDCCNDGPDYCRLCSKDDSDFCPICYNPYRTGPELERPVRTRCGHCFGDTCLKQWLSSGTSTCPICRAKLVEYPELITTYKDLGENFKVLGDTSMDFLDDLLSDSVNHPAFGPSLGTEDFNTLEIIIDSPDNAMVCGNEVSAANLLSFFIEKLFPFCGHDTIGQTRELQNLFAGQVENAKRRFRQSLEEPGLETLWDLREFRGADLTCALMSVLVEDFLLQLVDAEEYAQKTQK